MDSSSFTHQLYDIIFSRKLLLQTPVPSPSDHGTDRDPSASVTPQSSLDANVVMIMAVLLCALICALGLNSIVRCALRCSIVFDSNILAARRANVGVKKKALESFPTLTYSTETNLPGLDTECAICLSEFLVGERIRVLPTCNHGFHLRCIDRWLFSHSSCPTCRQCLLNTCQKIVSCNQTSHSQPSSLTPEIVILPLEAEGFVPSYRVTN